MAPQADLAQIGKEGFDLIDRFFGRKSSQNPHEELDPFKQQPGVIICKYYRPENPIVTERPPVSPQRHYVIFRASDDDVPAVSQSFHQNYSNGKLNTNTNASLSPRQQAMAHQDFGQIHPGQGIAQKNVVMNGTKLAKLSRGAAKVEVRCVN